MTNKEIIAHTAEYIRKKFEREGTGHDWWHIERVWATAKRLAKQEQANMLVVELGALLHDIADHKFHGGDITVGGKTVEAYLKKLKLDQRLIDQVRYIVDHISYRGGSNRHIMQSIEGKIVQDADRLDALGAIGIGRTFAYSGATNRPMHIPGVKPKRYASAKQMKDSRHVHTTINHFYEKLLLLKNRMNTRAGKALAKQRHEFMEKFLKQFYKEWNAK